MISIYDIMGNLLNISEDVKGVLALYPECSDGGLRLALRSQKVYKNKFFRYYNIDDDPLDTIEVNYLCEIDGIRFMKQTEVAEYCKVTRQAVSCAKQHKAKAINGKSVKWKE